MALKAGSKAGVSSLVCAGQRGEVQLLQNAVVNPAILRYTDAQWAVASDKLTAQAAKTQLAYEAVYHRVIAEKAWTFLWCKY